MWYRMTSPNRNARIGWTADPAVVDAWLRRANAGREYDHYTATPLGDGPDLDHLADLDGHAFDDDTRPEDFASDPIGTDWVRVARFWKPGDTVSLNVDRYARRVGDSVAVVEVYLGRYAVVATLPIRKFLRRFRVETGPVPQFDLQRLDEAIEKAIAYARSR